MRKNLTQKIIIIVAVLLVFLYGIFGIPRGVNGQAWKTALGNRIHLGLDLRGGAHLILQVQVVDAVNSETDNAIRRLQQDFESAGLPVGSVIKPDLAKPDMLRVTGTPADKSSDVRELLDQKYGNQYDIASAGDGGWTLTMKPLERSALEQKTVSQAIETIRDRVDSLGVSEPTIQEYGLGQNQVLVELPGVDDLDHVKNIIKSTARLEIHAVKGGPFADRESALQSVGGALPPDQMLAGGSAQVSAAGQGDEYYLLDRLSVVAGPDFRSADPSTDPNTGQAEVGFNLTGDAGNRFYDFTSKNINQRMAVVLNNRVREVANIQSAIRDQGRITGSFTKAEVEDLSKLLRTGALPASILYLEERTVGPSLGADSVRQGVTAAVAGMLAVMIFMLIYYRGAGINADLALFLNLVILLGFMGFTGSTLTLPGIAGVILTIGMGVDSNVLIFERIREELRAGKSPAAAVEQGFEHAWVTIIDTHVTTIVSAAILFLMGTGPVRGFAVTLTFGLLANLFTAVFVSRVIFDSHLNKRLHGEPISI